MVRPLRPRQFQRHSAAPLHCSPDLAPASFQVCHPYEGPCSIARALLTSRLLVAQSESRYELLGVGQVGVWVAAPKVFPGVAVQQRGLRRPQLLQQRPRLSMHTCPGSPITLQIPRARGSVCGKREVRNRLTALLGFWPGPICMAAHLAIRYSCINEQC